MTYDNLLVIIQHLDIYIGPSTQGSLSNRHIESSISNGALVQSRLQNTSLSSSGSLLLPRWGSHLGNDKSLTPPSNTNHTSSLTSGLLENLNQPSTPSLKRYEAMQEIEICYL